MIDWKVAIDVRRIVTFPIPVNIRMKGECAKNATNMFIGILTTGMRTRSVQSIVNCSREPLAISDSDKHSSKQAFTKEITIGAN